VSGQRRAAGRLGNRTENGERLEEVMEQQDEHGDDQ